MLLRVKYQVIYRLDFVLCYAGHVSLIARR